RDAEEDRQIPGAEHPRVPGHPEAAAGAVASHVRRQLARLAGAVGAVHEPARPGDAEPDAGVHGAEPEDVLAVPGADAEPGAQHVLGPLLPWFSRWSANQERSREAVTRKSGSSRSAVRKRWSIPKIGRASCR